MGPTDPKGGLKPPAPCPPVSSNTGPNPGPSGRPCGPCPPDQPTDGRPGPGTSAPPLHKHHMIPGLAASRPPQVGTPTRPHPPRPGTFLGGLPLPPSFPPPTFSSHLVAAGFPKRLGRVQRDKLSGKRETGAGEIRGRLGAAPAPRRVPGRRAANSRPGDDSRSGASGRRPPGQRELGRERGAGDRRARARGLARAVPEKGTRPAVKGAIPSGLLGPTGRGPGNELQTQKNEQGAGIRVCYRRLRNGASRGGPLRGLRPGARARRRLQRRA